MAHSPTPAQLLGMGREIHARVAAAEAAPRLRELVRLARDGQVTWIDVRTGHGRPAALVAAEELAVPDPTTARPLSERTVDEAAGELEHLVANATAIFAGRPVVLTDGGTPVAGLMLAADWETRPQGDARVDLEELVRQGGTVTVSHVCKPVDREEPYDGDDHKGNVSYHQAVAVDAAGTTVGTGQADTPEEARLHVRKRMVGGVPF